MVFWFVVLVVVIKLLMGELSGVLMSNQRLEKDLRLRSQGSRSAASQLGGERGR